MGAFLYCGVTKDQVGFGGERWFHDWLGPRIALDTAEMATSRSGSHFFGAFLLDDMPLGFLYQGRENLIGMGKRPYEHEEGYRRLLGLPRPREVRPAHIWRLTIHVDFAQNSHMRRRYEELRFRVRRHLESVVASCGAGVYVRRGLGGEPRVFVNEEEVVRILADAGFNVLDPATLTADETASGSLEARIVSVWRGSICRMRSTARPAMGSSRCCILPTAWRCVLPCWSEIGRLRDSPFRTAIS